MTRRAPHDVDRPVGRLRKPTELNRVRTECLRNDARSVPVARIEPHTRGGRAAHRPPRARASSPFRAARTKRLRRGPPKRRRVCHCALASPDAMSNATSPPARRFVGMPRASKKRARTRYRSAPSGDTPSTRPSRTSRFGGAPLKNGALCACRTGARGGGAAGRGAHAFGIVAHSASATSARRDVARIRARTSRARAARRRRFRARDRQRAREPGP